MTDEDESTDPGIIAAAERAILKFLRDREGERGRPDGVCTINEERELSTKKQSHDEASDSLYGAVTRMKPN